MVDELAIAGPSSAWPFGFAGAWGLRRGALPAAGLYPLATVAVIGGAYAAGQFAHGSGFLATYVAALILGNSRLPHRASTLSFAEGLGWLAQIGLFVMLGLYVDPTRLLAALVPGIVVGLLVLLIARPLSVIAAALPFRVPWREQAFLSWSGLRGAVPIVLAMIPLMLGRDGAVELVDIIVVVVVIYTSMQGTSLPWVARKLGVIEGGQATEIQLEAAPLDEMNAHVLQVTIPPESKMHGVYLSPVAAAAGCGDRVDRAGRLADRRRTRHVRLERGDQLLVVTPEKVRGATERRLRAVSRGGALASWFGERADRPPTDHGGPSTFPRERRTAVTGRVGNHRLDRHGRSAMLTDGSGSADVGDTTG